MGVNSSEFRKRKSAQAMEYQARKKAEDPAAWNAKENERHKAMLEKRRETDPDGYAAAKAKRAEQVREWHERKRAEDPEAYQAYMGRYRKLKAERTNP